MPREEGYYWVNDRGSLVRLSFHSGDRWYLYGDPEDEDGNPLREAELRVIEGPLMPPATHGEFGRVGRLERRARNRSATGGEDYYWVRMKGGGQVIVALDTGEGWIDIGDTFNEVLTEQAFEVLAGPLVPPRLEHEKHPIKRPPGPRTSPERD